MLDFFYDENIYLKLNNMSDLLLYNADVQVCIATIEGISWTKTKAFLTLPLSLGFKRN